MSSTKLAAVALAATVLSASGCGGSSKTTGSSKAGTLTRAELIAKADLICARVHAQYHANGYTSTASIAHLAPILAGYEQMGVDELRALQAPASLASDWNMILDNMQSITVDTAKLGQLAKEGKLKEATPLLSADKQTQQTALAKAARDGFKECSRAS